MSATLASSRETRTMKPIDRVRTYHPELTAQRRPAGLLGWRLRLVG